MITVKVRVKDRAKIRAKDRVKVRAKVRVKIDLFISCRGYIRPAIYSFCYLIGVFN